MQRLARIAWVAAALAALPGCGARRFYEGPPRPRSEIAVLRDSEDPDYKVYRVDGRSARAENELLPGSHRVGILHAGEDVAGYEFRARCYLTLQAEAGEEYRVVGHQRDLNLPVVSSRGLGRGYDWGAGIVSMRNRELVASCDCFEQWEDTDCD